MPGEMFDIRAHDTVPAAPGDLELVQRFLNLHEHLPDREEPVPASRELIEAFLKERALLARAEAFTEEDRGAALSLRGALHAKVRANLGGRPSERDISTIDDAARRAGLRPRFTRDGPALEPSEPGVDGALGHIVSIAFLADLDGSWEHLKECVGLDCDSVFYDRSKNHSARWCSMSACGNRAKVRAWRERRRADADA